MFTHPGTKLVFMGGEFGQTSEWNHDRSIDWDALNYAPHQGTLKLTKDLNALYKNETALYKYSFDGKGFEWSDYGDRENSVIVYIRKADSKEELMMVVCNFTPTTRQMYRIGVPFRGTWKEVFNSDDSKYGGSGVLNAGLLYTTPVKYHGKDNSVAITLPPLGMTILKLNEEMAEFDLD
jgi:1,4-alpha-glucan branching enzyme